MWLENFNDMRKLSGMSLDDLSEKSGVPKGTLAKITSGITKSPSLDTMRSLVYALGYTLKDLDDGVSSSDVFSAKEKEHIKKYRTLDGHGKKVVDFVLSEEAERVADERRRAIREEVEEPEDNVVYISLRCSIQSASAGTGTYLGPEAFETIHVRDNELTRRASFGVPVSGDSMEPTYHDGDILMVEGSEEIEVGEIGIFTIDGEGYVKELGAGELISLNPRYDPIPIGDSIRCHGRVIGILDTAWIEK